MKTCGISLKGPEKRIHRDHIRMGGTNPEGLQIGLNNYYLEMKQKPFFGIMGEIHFSRTNPDVWEDELLKMKIGGINVISTYLFWLHHEEEEGNFRWDGCRNLRLFVELCQKHNLLLVLRIGPFCHGEAHNGGLPDWLFGHPIKVRSNDPGYLAYAGRLYAEIGVQVSGLMFKDGGPIIGIQLENEYMHAGAPWEMTVGNSSDWISPGCDGESHILGLKELAKAAGMDAPLYTCTGWGGAAAPEGEVLALWGGYAFRPWLFYEPISEHPATEEYAFMDYHNNNAWSYNYDAGYNREEWPYACCEMGGGMSCFYPYRFTVPAESVDAMAIIKIAGGCNLIGYYMYHGGTNPTGRHGAFHNEYALPKLNYDYQAPLGEFGQTRDSYRRLKRLHAFLETCGTDLAPMRTVLPEGASTVDPHDVETVRYAVRTSGGSGFLFLNNYQDHWEMKDQKDLCFQLELEEETLSIPARGGLDLTRNTSCILPFHFKMSGAHVNYATAQPIRQMTVDDETWWFWYAPNGMTPEYCLDATTVTGVRAGFGTASLSDGCWFVRPFDGHSEAARAGLDQPQAEAVLTLPDGRIVHLITLTETQSLHLWQVEWAGMPRLVLTEATVIPQKTGFKLEQEGSSVFSFGIFPDNDLRMDKDLTTKNGLKKEYDPTTNSGLTTDNRLKTNEAVEVSSLEKIGKIGLFTAFSIGNPSLPVSLTVESLDASRAVLRLAPSRFDGCKQILLRVHAEGDVGYLWNNGKLVHDCFLNGAPWDVRLDGFKEALSGNGLYLQISPIKQGGRIKSDAMAARSQVFDKEIADILRIETIPVYEAVL